jgi:hypothetical protein
VKKELFISPSRLQKLTLKENDEFEQDTVLFKLKTWNHVSLWKWDVDCDICAICRVVVTEPCLKVNYKNDQKRNFFYVVPEQRKRSRGLRRGLGRVQPQLPQLLHVALGRHDAALPALPAKLGRSANRNLTKWPN